MSDPITQSTQSPQTVTSVQPSSANPATAAAVASSNSKTVDSNTKIGSLESLKEASPEVYNKMLQGMAQTICDDMKRQDNERKKKAKENNS